MFKAVLLVCAVSVRAADCQEQTALHVLAGPDCGNEIACVMQAQAYLASTEIGRSVQEVGYLKVKVVRRETRRVSSR